MGFFDFALTEEEQLKEQIENIIERIDVSYYNLYNGILVTDGDFKIYIETGSGNRVYSTSYVRFKGRILFEASDNEKLFNRLIKIILRKNKEAEEKNKEDSELNRKLLITEALAVLTSQEINNASKEVKDEFAPIFKDVRRVQEITKELESIRKSYTTI